MPCHDPFGLKRPNQI